MSSNLIAGVMVSAWLVSLAANHLQQTRDSAPARSAEMATISGAVVTADATARPLPGVVVTLNGAALPIGLSALTDDRGTFTIRGVPAGTVTITTSKAGWIAGAYGASRPGRPGTPVVLAPRAALTITISMAKGAVLTGTIRDDRGAPMVDVPVLVLDVQRDLQIQSQSLSAARGGSSARFTDDQGVFRVFGLVPGEYVVVAVPRGSDRPATPNLSDADVDALLAKLERKSPPSPAGPADPARSPAAIAPVFYPGTANLDDATRIRLDAGEERAGLDFVVTAAPLASVQGQISSDGIPASNVQLGLAPRTWAPLTGLSGARLSTKIDEDGRFKFADLIPGRYRLTARANASWTVVPGIGSPGTNPGGTLYGVADIEVAGADINGVEVRLQRGGSISGRASFDPPLSSLTAETRLVLTPAASYGPEVTVFALAATFQSMYTAPVDATGGAFDFLGLAPGTYRLELRTSSGLTGRWWLRSAMVNGRDLLDAPIDIKLGTALANVAVTIAQRHTELAGTLQSATGIPAPEYYVVVFPADRTLWTAGSRRIRSTRPATDGTFSFADLPPGAYLLAALADVEPDDWQRVEFLQELVPAAVKVTLGEDEKRRQDLRVAK